MYDLREKDLAFRRCAKHTELAIAISAALTFGSAHAGFPSNFNLSTVNGVNGSVFNGEVAEDYAGKSVSAAGDINGDGFDDLVLGAPYTANGVINAGSAYVLFGNGQPLSSPLNLSSLDVSSGLIITGVANFDFLGYAVNEAGDINGDGFDDLVIGAPTSSFGDPYAGAAFVIFGSDQPLPATLNIAGLDGDNGFAILGSIINSDFGNSVSGAGDVNGDLIADIIIGAQFTSTGSAYVVYGSDQSWNPTFAISDLDGTNGFRIEGADTADTFGKSVSAAGDINGDGFGDVVVGAILAGEDEVYSGVAYVIFGSDTGIPNPLDVMDLDGENGFAVVGLTQNDELGHSVSSAGDVNDDGFDDLIIGAHKADPNGSASGASYVIFGSDAQWSASLNVSTLNGANGFVINGESAGDQSGSSVNTVGDINQDDFDDLIIGAPLASPNGNAGSGAAYVVLGSDQAWPGSINLASLSGTNGFQVNGVSAGDEAGTSVSGAGDIDNDGVADFVIGAPKDDPNGAESGTAFVIYDTIIVVEGSIFDDGFEKL